jgi:hypothetical protein
VVTANAILTVELRELEMEVEMEMGMEIGMEMQFTLLACWNDRHTDGKCCTAQRSMWSSQFGFWERNWRNWRNGLDRFASMIESVELSRVEFSLVDRVA